MSNKYRFMYLRSNYEPRHKSAPIGCVAIQVNDKGRLSYQVSVCNPADNFDRAQARQLALGRLVEKPFDTIVPEVNPTMHDITRAAMLALEKNGKVATRARKAATAWLDSLGSYYFDLSDRPDAGVERLLSPFDSGYDHLD